MLGWAYCTWKKVPDKIIKNQILKLQIKYFFFCTSIRQTFSNLNHEEQLDLHIFKSALHRTIYMIKIIHITHMDQNARLFNLKAVFNSALDIFSI